MNKYAPHVYVIPEDRADEQIADGFVLHHRVKTPRIKVMPPAGGWPEVLKTFEVEYISVLRDYPQAHVILLIDFDDRIDERREKFARAIPTDIQARVFVIGPKNTPEELKREMNEGVEAVGTKLASDCDAGTVEYWGHDQLQHNDSERQRLVQTVRPFLF